MRQVVLPLIGTVAAFRQEARALAAAGVKADQILWHMGEGEADLFAAPTSPATDGQDLRLPREALKSVEAALCHRDPSRFSLIYSLLLRLSNRTLLWGDLSDGAMRRVLEMAKAVARDLHKMHAFVRFRDISDAGETRRRFAAWFEPEHHIVEAAAPFFARRFGDMDWAIATPVLTATFCNGVLELTETQVKQPPGEDATEDLWRIYYANIFNPGRLKPRAMQSEMPRKYWKNLPEAQLIPELIRTAPERVEAMRRTEAEAARPSGPLPRVAALARARAAAAAPAGGTLGDLRAAAAECERCPLHRPATQTVWGEGPEDARLMIVGEQPGDQEDLYGRPFVGPAGAVFDAAAKAAGIERSQVYITNAVKHFKFRPRGKLRLHQRPDGGEIAACKWWLDLERMRIRPKLIVAMGATAAEALTGTGRDLVRRCGNVERTDDGQEVLITLHPSYILRLPDPHARAEAEAQLRADFAQAARLAAWPGF